MQAVEECARHELLPKQRGVRKQCYTLHDKKRNRNLTAVVVGNCGISDDYDRDNSNAKWCVPWEMPPTTSEFYDECPRCPFNKDDLTLYGNLWPYRNGINWKDYCGDDTSVFSSDRSHKDRPWNMLPVIGRFSVRLVEGEKWAWWSGDSSANENVVSEGHKLKLCDNRTVSAIRIPGRTRNPGSQRDSLIPLGSCDPEKQGSCKNLLRYAYHFDLVHARNENNQSLYYGLTGCQWDEGCKFDDRILFDACHAPAPQIETVWVDSVHLCDHEAFVFIRVAFAAVHERFDFKRSLAFFQKCVTQEATLRFV